MEVRDIKRVMSTKIKQRNCGIGMADTPRSQLINPGLILMPCSPPDTSQHGPVAPPLVPAPHPPLFTLVGTTRTGAISAVCPAVLEGAAELNRVRMLFSAQKPWVGSYSCDWSRRLPTPTVLTNSFRRNPRQGTVCVCVLELPRT